MNVSAICQWENEALPLGKAWKNFWKEVLQAPNANYRRLLHRQKREVRRRVHRKMRRDTRRRLRGL